MTALGEHQVQVPLVDAVLRYELTGSPTMSQPRMQRALRASRGGLLRWSGHIARIPGSRVSTMRRLNSR
jgi:hypothetical protein